MQVTDANTRRIRRVRRTRQDVLENETARDKDVEISGFNIYGTLSGF